MAIMVSFFISYFLVLIYLIISFYIHEFGHIIFGILNDIISGQPIQNYTISHWISPIPGLWMPQQTRIIQGTASVNYVLGGILLTIIFWIIIFLIFYNKSNSKTRFILLIVPIFIMIEQFIINFICGTDNPLGHPFEVCHQNIVISQFFQWSFVILIILFILIIFPSIQFKLNNWVNDQSKKRAN